jgi:tRNA (mo5U34)-methyltransferase
MPDLVNAASRTRRRIEATKSTIGTVNFEWYPYDTLSAVSHFGKVLETYEGDFLQRAASEGVADLGCGDGELSLAFEELGCKVTAVDHQRTNHNGMRGLALLKEQMGARFDVLPLDLDTPFTLPATYGLTLLLGTLYHVKNPLYVLEQIARTSRYCLLSTRITRNYPGGKKIPEGAAVAYLLEEGELNADDSNYWIFSNAGLLRLLRRSHWDVVRYSAYGPRNSDPNTVENDERAFCLLQSRFGLANIELAEGWHEPDEAGWRWTARRFEVVFKTRGKRGDLSMKAFFPPSVFETIGIVTLRIFANGEDLGHTILDAPGTVSIFRRVPSCTGPVRLVFELDKGFHDPLIDERELGLIVSQLELT